MKTGMTISLTSMIALCLSSQPAMAQDACGDRLASLNAAGSRFSDEQKRIQEETDGIQSDSAKAEISAIVDVKMKEQRWVFDLPTATMQDRRMSLDLPQVTMKLRTMSWDNPVTVMKTVKTGEYPEFYCDKSFIPKCTVRWSPIYADIPTIEMRRQEVKFDVPEFTMARTEFVMGVPEFSMARQEWLVKIPEVTLRDIRAEADELKTRGERVGEKARALAAQIRTETAGSASALYQCYRDDLNGKRVQITAQFDQGIGQLEASIAALAAQGADPSAVRSDGGVINLLAQRDKLVRSKAAALEQIETAVRQLEASQKKLTDEVIT